MRKIANFRFTIAALAIAATVVGCGGGGNSAVEPQSSTSITASGNGNIVNGAAANTDMAMPAFKLALGELSEPTGNEANGVGSKFLNHAAVGVETAATLPVGPQNPKVYAPADIRAAYNMPALLASSTSYSTLTAAQAAAYGAGATIYIVDAYHSPTALADLNTMSAKYNLPGCTAIAITKAAALPAARTNGCDFGVVYMSTTGAFTTTPPAVNTAWDEEIAIDTQWAHAVAPLARIVLIETANSFSNPALIDGVMLANTFGPGTVSMSWSMPEFNWNTESMWDTYFFSGVGMSYFAAAGDAGSQVNWPAASPNVTGVGGTTLTWNGSGTRSEVGWSGSGGGYSKYYAAPTYQSSIIIPTQTMATQGGQLAPGATARGRAVPDVSMVADPYSGVYTAFTYNGAVHWYAMGGTSVGTPIMAALAAVGNATRVLNHKATLGQFNANWYNGDYNYASNSITDITTGNNCVSTTGVVCTLATDAAKVGWDPVTGWGTPNGTALVTNMEAH